MSRFPPRSFQNGVMCIGVDANRNFGYQWNQGGSSTASCDITYHGPEPYSEAEVRAIRDFIMARCEENIFTALLDPAGPKICTDALLSEIAGILLYKWHHGVNVDIVTFCSQTRRPDQVFRRHSLLLGDGALPVGPHQPGEYHGH